MRFATKAILSWIVFWLVVGLLGAATLRLETRVSAQPKLTIRVTPLVGMAPVDARVIVQIEQHPDNRAALVTYASDAEYRSSFIQLDGELAPRTHEILMKRLPGGEATFTVEVFNSEGEIWARVVARATYTGMTYTLPEWQQDAGWAAL